MLILFIEITSPFLKTPYKQKTKKLSNNLPNFYEKHTKQKVIKKNNQDTSQVILNVLSSSIFFQDLHGFSKRQSKMATFSS